MGKLFLLLVLLWFCWLWSGCASEQSYRDYTVAYTGWTAVKAKQEVKNRELVRIEAAEGQPITITAKTFVVYMPNSKEDDNTIPPPQQIKDSEWVKPVTNLFDGAAKVGLAAIIGNTASNVVGSLANAKGDTTSTSTTTSTDSHNTTSTATTTSTTTSTDSHNTTTSTDSHNTTTTSTDSHNSTPTTTTTTTGATGTTTGGTVTQ